MKKRNAMAADAYKLPRSQSSIRNRDRMVAIILADSVPELAGLSESAVVGLGTPLECRDSVTWASYKLAGVDSLIQQRRAGSERGWQPTVVATTDVAGANICGTSVAAACEGFQVERCSTRID
jgi:hypothetical protein